MTVWTEIDELVVRFVGAQESSLAPSLRSGPPKRAHGAGEGYCAGSGAG